MNRISKLTASQAVCSGKDTEEPMPSSTKGLVDAVRDQVRSLQFLLQAIDADLRQAGSASDDEAGEAKYGLNGALEDVLDTVDASRQTARRLSVYLGVKA